MTILKIHELNPIIPSDSAVISTVRAASNPMQSSIRTKGSRAGQRRMRIETLTQPNLAILKSEKVSNPPTTSIVGSIDPIVIGIMILLAVKLEGILSSLEDDKIQPLKQAISEYKHQILFLQQEIAKNRSLIEKLQSDGLQSKESIEALAKSLLRNQELTARLQRQAVQHDQLITQLQSVVSKNAEFSQKLQEAISENKRMIAYLQKEVSDIRAVQDTLVKYGNNADGLPALHAAIKNGDKTAVELLIKHGADVNAKAVILSQNGSVNYSALQFAVLLNHAEIIQFLIKNGAEQEHKKLTIDLQKLNDLLMEAAAKKENPIVIAFQRFDLQMAEYLLKMRSDDLVAGKKPTLDFPGYNFTRVLVPGSSSAMGVPHNIANKLVPVAVLNNFGVVEYQYQPKTDIECLQLLIKYDDRKIYKQTISGLYSVAYYNCDLEAIIFLYRITKSDGIPIPYIKHPSRLIDVFSGNIPFNQKNKQHFFDGMGQPPGNIFEFRNDDNEKVRELKRQIKILMNL